MSLILEALKKSEAERQRAAGPTLLEVRVARPRQRYPLWAVAVGVLLLVNMVLLLVFVLRRPTAALAAPVPTAVSAVAAAPPTTPAPAAVPFAAAPPTAIAAPAAGIAGLAGNNPSVAPLGAPPRGPEPDAPSAEGSAGTPPTLDDSRDEAPNPADEVPAVAAGSGVPAAGSVKVQRESGGNYASLPSSNELSDLPPLSLDLHVYADRPRDRYALINMHSVHEGDSLPEGIRVLAITRDGVALDYRGQQFMLRPQQ